MSDGWGPGTNTGHGRVWKRPDGMVVLCGGPDTCRSCMADAAALAGRIGGERVPALRWESIGTGWRGYAGSVHVGTVSSGLPRDVAERRWYWIVVTATGYADGDDTALEAAKAAAEAAWCERAGLVAREGIVPGYKGAEGQAPDADAHRPERDGPERDDAGAAP